MNSMIAADVIFVVEDEPKLARLLADYLRAAGFDPVIVERGDTVLAAIAEHRPVLVLLDINLPGMDGLTLCKEIRRDSNLPIIMVTSRAEEIDRLLGLELGADDYICKPFSPREVVARVRAVLRRGRAPEPQDAELLRIDADARRVELAGKPVSLTGVEFELLRTLVERPGRVFSRAELLDRIYDDFRDVSDRAVDSHIKNLRRKLDQAMPGRELIHSVYGVGYRYEPAHAG
ncbi:response regulator [Pseudofulvimonas gallinarii]|uniref:Two-component system response regulator BaeR n=1 Tax=Pseudofulvimonas gallinarii TaxID=634155 RepID=A0A4S3KY75_9GAMM|nr:response regulator [Pseudofulvimonas gallinarii]TCS98845.1 two-component system response regulator BaeR [Pseudofulvimonas gallinarii]THD14327.1 two-component system response regulator BaeR [Pseudofulvimonas gallinarii]